MGWWVGGLVGWWVGGLVGWWVGGWLVVGGWWLVVVVAAVHRNVNHYSLHALHATGTSSTLELN